MLRSLAFLPMLVLCLFMTVPPLRKISDNMILNNYYKHGFIYTPENISGDYGFFFIMAISPILFVYREILRKPFKSWIEYEDT